jgi:hypothetical protein
MRDPSLPGAVNLARVLLIAESVLWLPLPLWIAGMALGAIANPGDELPGLTILFAFFLLAVAGLILWFSIGGFRAGGGLANLDRGSRSRGLQLAALGVVVGILLVPSGWIFLGGAISGGGAPGWWQSAPGVLSLVVGPLAVVVNAVIIYCLAIDPGSRTAFRGVEGGRPAGAAPTWDGWSPGFQGPLSASPPWPPGPPYGSPPPPPPPEAQPGSPPPPAGG